MEYVFKDKVVLITGASSGIGKSTALAFAKQGAILALADIQTEPGQALAESIQKAGVQAIFHTLDVTDAAGVEAWVKDIAQRFGRIDIAINNAGIDGTDLKTHEYPLDLFDKVMQINVQGVWYCMRAQLPFMLAQQEGVIVNTASIAGLGAFHGHSAYAASKHAVIGLTRTAAVEYAKYGIRVNAVCPGFTETPMVFNAVSTTPDKLNKLAYINPTRRIGKPEEIADAILYLSSPQSSYVNGQSLAVDGGLSIN
ncbi:SDR family NAD(P)-dependent oxidoreductase [Eisenibacter elegans]|jgi:NAD(P)-dependent dehydrogenase (short-subunit alcohol dehydrogenase family)|uniref:SDR family NAD(P)-dependent oxidoreductase n=1 Tax=Eisenibacter elegans TaxID=997 RepID=UPI00041F0EC5|nr:glucose 1-dehydrogenase [Eisenibacter elegans]